MGDIGKPCTHEEGCTLPNIYCAYPNCARGKVRKEAGQLRGPTDTAFLEGVKAGLEAAANSLKKQLHAEIYNAESVSARMALMTIRNIDPTTIKPVTCVTQDKED